MKNHNLLALLTLFSFLLGTGTASAENNRIDVGVGFNFGNLDLDENIQGYDWDVDNCPFCGVKREFVLKKAQKE